MRRRALGTDLTAYRLCNPGALKWDDVSLEPAAAQPLQPIKTGTAEGRSGFCRSAREARGCLDSTAEEVSSRRRGSDTRVETCRTRPIGIPRGHAEAIENIFEL